MADWLAALGTSLVVIFLAEMGDKTQLLTISFAAKYPRWLVFWAVFSAMALLTILAVIIGDIIVLYVPLEWLKLASGVVFIAFGAWGIAKRNEAEEEDKSEADNKKPFIMIFGMLLIAELGDKTQLSAIALTTAFDSPVAVGVGAVLGFAAVVAVGVLLGEVIARKVKRSHIVVGSSAFSMALGAFFIVEALWL